MRPHAYSRYVKWSNRFGPNGAMELIEHEMAHLPAFENLTEEEGIAEEVCLKFGETFDAAMTDEAWTRLKGALDAMRRDHGDDHEIVKVCRVIEDAHEAEEFTQMKGALAAVVHPAGQMSVLPNCTTLSRRPTNIVSDGHTNWCTHSCASFCRKATSICKLTPQSRMFQRETPRVGSQSRLSVEPFVQNQSFTRQTDGLLIFFLSSIILYCPTEELLRH